jgi:hypothetical protein
VPTQRARQEGVLFDGAALRAPAAAASSLGAAAAKQAPLATRATQINVTHVFMIFMMLAAIYKTLWDRGQARVASSFAIFVMIVCASRLIYVFECQSM